MPNSYEIIKSGLKNELSDIEITEELQISYPNTDTETCIALINETKQLLKTDEYGKKEHKPKHFLVKLAKDHYMDLETFQKFKEFKDLPYSKCKHGLCDKYKKTILKRIVKSKKNPNIFIATEPKLKKYEPFKSKFRDSNGHYRIWEFDSYEINECYHAIIEGLTERQIAIQLCCPRECVPKLIKHIELKDKLRNGNNKGKNKRRRRTTRKY